MRKLFFVLALFFSWTTTLQAQTQGRELTSRGITDSTQVFVPSNGSTLAYILQANAWRVWINGVKTNPFKTATNGMYQDFNHYGLGGTLIKHTNISGANTYGLSFTSLTNFQVISPTSVFVLTVNPGGAFNIAASSSSNKTKIRIDDTGTKSSATIAGGGDDGTGELYFDYGNISTHGAGTFFKEEGEKRGIRYNMPDYDDWTDSTLVTKGWVLSAIDTLSGGGDEGDYWPLSGEAELTDDVVIETGDKGISIGIHPTSDGFTGSTIEAKPTGVLMRYLDGGNPRAIVEGDEKGITLRTDEVISSWHKQIGVIEYVTSHGLAVGDWITVDLSDGGLIKGSDPSTQPFIGIVAIADDPHNFVYVKPGDKISGLTSLTAGQMYYAQADGSISITSSPKPVMIATSATTGVLLSGSFGVTLPPPSVQASSLFFSSVTSSSLNIHWIPGNGTGSLVVMSENPISNFPVSNTDYTATADANFGAGYDLGGGIFVVFAGDGNTVAITGLSPSTQYHVAVFSFVQDGLFVTYNTSLVSNYADPFTLADAATPTQQWVTTKVVPREESIRVTGVRGNGYQIIVVASVNGKPDTNPTDGVSYTAGALGVGQAIGNGFVAYKGTSTNFSIDGLSRDRKVWWKAMEMENTGSLYNTNAAIDSAYTAIIGRDDIFQEGSGIPPGLSYLVSSSNVYAYYNLDSLTFADEANITNGDVGLIDRSVNSNTATIVGSSPKTDDITINAATRKSARGSTNTGLSTNNTGTTWFGNASGFEVVFSGVLDDGITAGGGAVVFGTQGSGFRCDLRFINDGRAQFQYTTAAGASNGTTSGAVVVDGLNIFNYGVLRVDFTTDVASITVNGTTSNFSFSGTALSAHDPTAFSSSENVYIGVHNNAGGPTGNTNSQFSISRIAFSGLLTTQEREDIGEWMSFTVDVGSPFTYLDVVTGLTVATVNDSLHVSGTGGAFGNYLTFKTILPDTLEEFIVHMPFKISGSLTTNASGLGVGVRNDWLTENNYAQVGQLNLDTDAGSFAKLQLFRGNGTTGAGAGVFSGTSSGAVQIAEGSSGVLTFGRKLLVDNSTYTIDYWDLSDSSELSISYTSINRPLSAFFGTTAKIYIWPQGPDYLIDPYNFYVVRTGTAFTTPPPVPTTADVYVNKTGSDANDCVESLPCLTITRGLQRVAEIAGSNRTLLIGPGVYVEAGQLSVPLNLGTMQGAGKDATIITGASNQYRGFSGANESFYLLRAVSATAGTTGNHTFKDFALEGAGRQMPGGLFIKNRDGIVVQNCAFRNFNTVGSWFYNSDDGLIENCEWTNAGGDNASPTCANMNPQPSDGTVASPWVSGAIAVMNISNYEFSGGAVNNMMFRSGYGHKYLSNVTDHGNLTNVRYHHMTFNVNQFGVWETSGGFQIANIVAEFFKPGYRGTFEIDNCSFTGGFLSVATKPTETAGTSGTVSIHDNVFMGTEGVNEFSMELYVHNLEVYNNFISRARRMVMITGSNNPSAPEPDVLTNWNFHNNYVEITNVANGIFSMSRRCTNCTVKNNTFVATSVGASGTRPFLYSSTNISGESTWLIEDNAFYGSFSPNSTTFYVKTGSGGGLSGSTIRNNLSTQLNPGQSISGVTSTANQIISGTNWFNFSGAKPTPYYATPSGSPLRDAGNDGDDAGAYQQSISPP